MDLKNFLSSSGIPFEDTAWTQPPGETYGVFLDNSENRGADDKICISEHTVTVEIYSELVDNEAKAKIEKLFLDNAIAFSYFGRTWIDSERMYQTAWEFSFTEKL